MQTMIVRAIAMMAFLAVPQITWAQTVESSVMGLKMDGWDMILPDIIEENDGRMWIRYQLPNGGYESFPFKIGDPLTVKWSRPGMSSIRDYPAGWSVEDTEAIVDWHMNGGRGSYVVDGDDWKPVTPQPPAPTPRPATPVPAPSRAPASSDSTSSTEDDCSGPFCNPVTVPGSVSTADDVDRAPPPNIAESDPIMELGARMNAAKKRCFDPKQTSSEICDEYQKLYAEYKRATGG